MSLSSSALDLFLKRAVKGLDFYDVLLFFENCFDWKINEVKIISHVIDDSWVTS